MGPAGERKRQPDGVTQRTKNNRSESHYEGRPVTCKLPLWSRPLSRSGVTRRKREEKVEWSWGRPVKRKRVRAKQDVYRGSQSGKEKKANCQ